MVFTASRDLASDATLTEAMSFFGEKLIQKINTITLAKVISANPSSKRLQITPLINGLNADNTPITPPTIYDVPYCAIRGGNAGIITEFAVGDTVVVGFCQRQIDNTKQNMNQSTPSLLRYFSLQDAVVLAHWSNNNPSVFLKLTSGEVVLESQALPITINTTNTIAINANNATIKSTNVTLQGDVTINGSLTIGQSSFSSSGTSKIDGKQFLQHMHTGVASGGAISGPVS